MAVALRIRYYKEPLERDTELTLEVAKEALKATEQKLNIKEENSIKNAHRATIVASASIPKSSVGIGLTIPTMEWSGLRTTQIRDRTSHPERPNLNQLSLLICRTSTPLMKTKRINAETGNALLPQQQW